jgi:2-keto-3-deoxy-L-rhamnonate aldolase RhmA
MTGRIIGLAVVAAVAVGAAPHARAQARHQHAVLDLWTQGKTAFGVFVPNENPAPRQRGVPPPPAIYSVAGGEALAANPLYDFVFLNLEPGWDAAAVKNIATGLRGAKASSRKTLIVRLQTIEDAGAEATKAHVKEAFDLGADGVTIPHVRDVEEAKLALSFFRDAKVDVWSPQNPKGEKLAMLMIEDPGALQQARQIADLPGYSILACGIGSLTQALKGDRAAAEAGNQAILAETKRAKLVNMLTASTQDVEQRVKEGFLGLLGMGAPGDEMIKLGRKAAGR